MNRTPQFITAGFLFLYALILVLWFLPGAIICLAGSVALLILNRPKSDRKVEKVEKVSQKSDIFVPTAAGSAADRRPSADARTIADPVPAMIQSGYKQESFHVTGMQYYEPAFRKLASVNDFYEMKKRDLIDADLTCERIYEFDYAVQNITLVEEPTNKYDPNAIKVIADGNHVGYIKKGSTSRIRNIIKAGIISIQAEAGGGKYKYIDDDGRMESGTAPYFMHLTIRFKGGSQNGNR